MAQALSISPCALTTPKGAVLSFPPPSPFHALRSPNTGHRAPAARARGVPRMSAAAPSHGAGAAAEAPADEVPEGCFRFKVDIAHRPLGIVFEERRGKGIFVAELPPGGKASHLEGVEVGDELTGTSAVVYDHQDDYGLLKVPKGMKTVWVPTRGETFNAIMAAIESNPPTAKVTLELQKCK